VKVNGKQLTNIQQIQFPTNIILPFKHYIDNLEKIRCKDRFPPELRVNNSNCFGKVEVTSKKLATKTLALFTTCNTI